MDIEIKLNKSLQNFIEYEQYVIEKMIGVSEPAKFELSNIIETACIYFRAENTKKIEHAYLLSGSEQRYKIINSHPNPTIALKYLALTNRVHLIESLPYYYKKCIKRHEQFEYISYAIAHATLLHRPHSLLTHWNKGGREITLERDSIIKGFSRVMGRKPNENEINQYEICSI